MNFKFNLGDQVRDQFTGFTGHVHAVAKYITGCDRCLVNPRKLDEKGAPVDGTWFDDTQLELVAAKPQAVPESRGGPAPSGESDLRRG